MKRYIYAMAFSKKELRLKIESLADIVQRHVTECVIYGEWEGTRHHWITEIASWLAKISRMKCKSKVTDQDYLETLFAVYGDEEDDAESYLMEYHDSAVRKARYPDFEITDELVAKTFEIYQRFIEVCLGYLLSGHAILEEDWIIILDTEVFK